MNVGLNISAKNIRVISIEGKRVKKWGMVEIPPNSVRDGLILEPKTLGPVINNLFKESRIPRDRVTASISGLSFTYRFITLPRMKPDQVEEAVLRAARKEISIPLDELYVSWQQFPDTGNEMSFFVLGVERNRIDAMVETLKAAHIEPYLMGIRPLALTRIAGRSDGIVVNIEENCFDIVFMSKGVPRVIHTINPRFTNVTMEDNIHRLADELTKTATFYQSNNPDAQMDNTTPLLITGDWAAEPTAVALLQTEVDYPISRLIAQVEMPKGFPMDSYATVIGLALKKAPPKTAKFRTASYIDVNVNILAGKYRKPKAKPIRLSRVLAWTLLAAVIILLFPVYQAWTNVKSKSASLDLQITDVQRQINLTNIISDDDAVIKNQITALKNATGNVTAAFLDILGNRGGFRKNLELVNTLMPPKTYFSAIEILNNEVLIYGESDSVFTVVDYAAKLEKQGPFIDVRIDKLEEAPSAFLTTESANVTAVPTDLPVPVTVIKFVIIIKK